MQKHSIRKRISYWCIITFGSSKSRSNVSYFCKGIIIVFLSIYIPFTPLFFFLKRNFLYYFKQKFVFAVEIKLMTFHSFQKGGGGWFHYDFRRPKFLFFRGGPREKKQNKKNLPFFSNKNMRTNSDRWLLLPKTIAPQKSPNHHRPPRASLSSLAHLFHSGAKNNVSQKREKKNK